MHHISHSPSAHDRLPCDWRKPLPRETLPLTGDLRRWAADTVPRLPLEREQDIFLCYVRAHGLTQVDWSEALKLWWLEAHAYVVRRDALQLPAAPRPAPVPEAPPFYDVEQHAQKQADIPRLCGPMGPSMSGMNDSQGLRRRRVSSILAAEGTARARDPAYLTQMQARKAELHAQAVVLRAQESYLEAVAAAD